jgi:hypothetical protein
MRWRDRIRRAVDRAKWHSWRFFNESANVLIYYFRLEESRGEDAKLDQRVARLTLKQYAFWVRASADAMAGRMEEGSGTLEDKCEVFEIARQRAWERLYERWPQLKGKL